MINSNCADPIHSNQNPRQCVESESGIDKDVGSNPQTKIIKAKKNLSLTSIKSHW